MSLSRRDHDDADDHRRRVRLTIDPLDPPTLGRRSADRPAEPGGGPVIFGLELGQHGGRELRSADGPITSGTVAFRSNRHEGGGRPSLRFRRRHDELQALAQRPGGGR